MATEPTPRSLFVVGSPRSGSSVFFRTLAAHPAFACTTNLTRRFRAHFGLVRMAELLGGRHRPVEAKELWRSFWPNGRRERGEEDLTERQRRFLRRIVVGHTRHFGRPIFLNKHPGMTMRIRWIAAGLPRARFVHLLRDGRAAAASILWQCEKRGRPRWSYLGKDQWPELAEMDSASFAGAIWARLAIASEEALADLEPGRGLTVRYEDFVEDPGAVVRAVARFAGTEWEAAHDALLPDLVNRNTVPRRSPAPEDRARIEEQARPALRRFGYA